MATFVYDFSEGGMDQKDLLGGKGAKLAEMTKLGLPVPPGFTIRTGACRAYMKAESWTVSRVRTGAYRIIYRVEDERLLVVVVKVGHRGDVYR